MKKITYIGLSLYTVGIICHIVYLFTQSSIRFGISAILSLVLVLGLAVMILMAVLFLKKPTGKKAFLWLIISVVSVVFEIFGLIPLVPQFIIPSKFNYFSIILTSIIEKGDFLRLPALILFIVISSIYIFQKKDKGNEN